MKYQPRINFSIGVSSQEKDDTSVSSIGDVAQTTAVSSAINRTVIYIIQVLALVTSIDMWIYT